MQKIIPYLWMDRYPEDPAGFYCSVFENARIVKRSVIRDTPSGDVDTVVMDIGGFEFILLIAGPEFRINPSVSFLVGCHRKEEVDRIREGLMVQGGKELMPLDSYPFSERYVWLEDRYGLSWQIMYTRQPGNSQFITPTLMFTGEQCGRAEEAVDAYTALFPDAGVEHILRYGEDAAPNESTMVMHEGFSLCGISFAAMDSAFDHRFSFNEGLAFMVSCDDQKEIDRYWDALSAHPEAEQCGWLKDRFGFSWQIVPAALDELLSTEDPEQASAVTRTFLRMKKLDLEALKKAGRMIS